VLYCRMKRWSEARDLFERFAATDFQPGGDRGAAAMSIFCNALLADVCADLADRRRAKILYDRLPPSSSEHATNGCVHYGSVSHHLGRLASTLGRIAEAKADFETALEHHRRLGARTWIARTQYYYAKMLLSLDDERDQEAG